MPDFKGEIELDGLTMKQYRAAVMLASGKYAKSGDVADKLKIKKSELNKWKNMPNFRMKIVQIFQEVAQQEITSRTKTMKKILKPLYSEIRKRLNENELADMSFSNLIKLMSAIHLEMRSDLGIISRLPINKVVASSPREQDDEYGENDFSGRDAMRTAAENYQEERMKALEKTSDKVVSIHKNK